MGCAGTISLRVTRMSKQYYSADEALEFLAKATNQPFTDRDLVDLARREKLSLCFYVTATFGIYYPSIGQWGTTEKFGYHVYFRGYAKVRPLVLWNLSKLPGKVGAVREYERLAVDSERTRTLAAEDVFISFERQPEILFSWGLEWCKVRFDVDGLGDNGADSAAPEPIELLREDILIPTAELQAVAHPEVKIAQLPIADGAQHFHSDQLQALLRAARKFWQNAKRDDKGTHPSNAQVAQWLEDNGFSATLAKHAASILRPEWAEKGRPPEK